MSPILRQWRLLPWVLMFLVGCLFGACSLYVIQECAIKAGVPEIRLNHTEWRP